MDSNHIVQIIRETAMLLNKEYVDAALSEREVTPRNYGLDEIEEFKRDLTETGNKVRIIFMENAMFLTDFPAFLKTLEIPIVVFEKRDEAIVPAILYKDKGKIILLRMGKEISVMTFTPNDCQHLLTNGNQEITFLIAFSYKSLVSEDAEEEEGKVPLSPVKRLFRLLSEEKKDIFNIFIYAIFIGLISLTLPLGIQATVELVSGGVVVSSVYVLIALVILGILAAGGLQIMQITVVEYLQRRIFTKAALEFSFRVPRIKVEAILHQHAPELMNRFFDVLTLQKGLPKLLIDLTSGAMQVFFGLVLLSFYHPFFVFFGLVLVGTLTLIFYLTGPQGLSSSIKESKFKYKVVYWLEELARVINSFKISGNTSLPIKKTEHNVNNYLKYRKAHFRVLINQYLYIILFKAVITGGVLIIGTILVVQREITLGQFVASEVIIILILNSVEKIILYMEVIYDLLTAVDKIAQVTDLPLEKSGGIDMPRNLNSKGFSVSVKDLYYKYPENRDYTLKGINLEIKSGEKICISGSSDAGKTTLTNTISGLHHGYEGSVTIDNISLRDLDLTNLRDQIGKNVSQEDIFDGTLQENILVGKPYALPKDAIEALQKVNLSDVVNRLPDGLNTHIVSGGKGFSQSFISRLILARCLAKKPKLLILNDYFNAFQKSDKLELINFLTKKENGWTLMAVSNDPIIMTACDRVLLMENGSIAADGTYQELLNNKLSNNLILG